MFPRQLGLGAVLLTVCAASARGDVIPAEAPPPHAVAPRTLTLEFKLGPYKPLIDREAALTGKPYETIFGNSSMLLFEFEIDRIFWQKFGTLAVGGSVGYAAKTGNALIAPGNPGEGTPSGDTTTLRVIPVRLLLVYRFDVGAIRSGIPFVPYAKTGLVFEPWWATKAGSLEYANGKRALGAKWGWDITGGISLMLDFLEPRLAKDFSNDIGISHSYLFAEYTYANVNNFGSKGLDLSSRHWMFGFSVDY